jgi:hypothetical protein
MLLNTFSRRRRVSTRPLEQSPKGPSKGPPSNVYGRRMRSARHRCGARDCSSGWLAASTNIRENPSLPPSRPVSPALGPAPYPVCRPRCGAASRAWAPRSGGPVYAPPPVDFPVERAPAAAEPPRSARRRGAPPTGLLREGRRIASLRPALALPSTPICVILAREIAQSAKLGRGDPSDWRGKHAADPARSNPVRPCFTAPQPWLFLFSPRAHSRAAFPARALIGCLPRNSRCLKETALR